MPCNKYFITLCAFAFLFIVAKSQQLPPNTGLIKATVKDSATKEPLAMATVSAYRVSDSLFLKALFSGNNGSFALRALPVDTAIKLTISYVGYKRYLKTLTIAAAIPELDLGDIFLSNNANPLEVVIKAELPALRMKGDTLEINPAAFNAGPNAVVEDMLKKVPGVVIWGDNKITVNGKPVKEVLVDGKPFLTGNIAVATQNLPAEIIEKVQVYGDKKDPESRTMNMVLKDGKKNGRFGKLSAAAGTGGRYEGDATWNLFKPKQQISIGAVANNTNKVSGNLGEMFNFNTYGGNISNPAHQSDFSREGTNQYAAAGLSFNKEMPGERWLRSEYFGYRNVQDTRRSQSSATLVGDSSYLGSELSNSISKDWRHRATGSYNWINNQKQELRTDAELITGSEELTSTSRSSTNSSSSNLLNQSNRYETGHNQHQDLQITTIFNNHPLQAMRGLVAIEHTINLGNRMGNRTNINDYSGYGYNGNILETNNINRLFEDNNKKVENHLNTTYEISWLFNRLRNSLHTKDISLDINLLNSLHHTYNTGSAAVSDFNAASGMYSSPNVYLSNTNKQHYLEAKPGFGWKVWKQKILSSRYMKKLDFSGKLEWQYKMLHNNSDKKFRTIHNGYMALLPSANLTYMHTKAQAFIKQWSAKYFTDTRIPDINELAPLTDSTNLLYLQIGNPNLTMQYSHNGELSYKHTSLKNNQIIGTQLNVRGFSNKIIVVSTITPQGRQEVSFANANNYKNAMLAINYSRPIKLRKATLNIAAHGETNYETGDLYINKEKGSFQNCGYSISNKLNFIIGPTEINLNQYLRWSQNRLQLAEQRSTANTNYTATAMLQRKLGRLTAATNVNLVYNAATQIQAVAQCIWNVALAYRLTKNQQLQIELSLNDILKQNQKITNMVALNNVRQTEVNRLTKFALFSLIYYPRRFGNK